MGPVTVRGARHAGVERFAMPLPEVTQAPHHHFGSWRVGADALAGSEAAGCPYTARHAGA